MKHCVITFRSVMPAQRGEEALGRGGIRCQLTRTPSALEALGCGYCIWVSRAQARAAVARLHEERISYQKVYELRESGQWEQVRL